MENNNPQKPQNDIQAPAFVPDTKVQHKSHLDKLTEIFLPEDLNAIGGRIVQQIMIPTILKTAGDIIHRSIDMIFGTNYTGVNTQTQQSAPTQNWTSYQAQSRNVSGQPTGTMQILPVRSGVYDFAEVRFKTIQDAQTVLNNMRSVLQTTGVVSVGMYMNFSNAKTLPEDFNYGWTNLTTVSVASTGDRDYPWRMVLPTPIPIRNNEQKQIYI